MDNFLNFEELVKNMKMNFSDLWALATFTYHKEKRGEKTTYNSFIERFGKKETDTCLEEMMFLKQPLIYKSGDYYHTSRTAEIEISRIRNLL